jgi:hypothetical protein
MPLLPVRLAPVILALAPRFSPRVWPPARALLLGAMLAPGQRTVTSGWRILGLSQERRFVNYHRVRNRARWRGREASRLLFKLCVDRFRPDGPLLLGVDDTIERRRGKHLQAKGLYRDPVRRSPSPLVQASGLPWVSRMLWAPGPWAARPWALPFLTCLAPSKRYRLKRRKRHQPVLDGARQRIFQAQRWRPYRELVVVGDSAFSAWQGLQALARQKITVVTRLRLEAALYEPAPFPPPGTNGRSRQKGKRLSTLRRVLEGRTTRWPRLTVPGGYGEGDRIVEICTRTAVWHHTGLPAVPIRWVLIRDPQQRFDPQALLCTDLTPNPLTIVSGLGALANRGDLTRSAKTSRPGNAKARGGAGHRQSHAVLAGAVFCSDLAGGPTRPPRHLAGSARGLVQKATPCFRRGLGGRSSARWEANGFSSVPPPRSCCKTPPSSTAIPDLCSVPCGLRAKVELMTKKKSTPKDPKEYRLGIKYCA